MKIIQKIVEKSKNLQDSRQPVIAFLGDSVTQGCFECYSQGGVVDTVYEPQSGYAARLEWILNHIFPRCPITFIHAGVCGDRAEHAKNRLQRDVLEYHPDLVVVCFALNDMTAGEEGLERYIASLKEIFARIKTESKSEIIFLAPNLGCEEIDGLLTDRAVIHAAQEVSDAVKSGYLDQYIREAKTMCKEEQIPVCDCYKIWKDIKNYGADINSLLSNKINHPIREMHWIFAYELLKTMLSSFD